MPLLQIIVIGASAGGIEPLRTVLEGLPNELPAAVLVVIHTSPDSPGLLPRVLRRTVALPVMFPANGDLIHPGVVYVAPPNLHLFVHQRRLVVSYGAKENGFRPAIDPLFRTTASSFDGRTVGVILSGALHDGTFGLMAIKRAGGTAIVQSPDDALIDSMPLNAIRRVEVDHIVPASEIAPLLTRLMDSDHVARQPASHSIESVKTHSVDPTDQLTIHGPDALNGPPSIFTCPACGGVMWEIWQESRSRFRCHTGHGFSPEALLKGQSEKFEEALWSAVRVLRERAAVYRSMVDRLEPSQEFARLAAQYHAMATAEDDKAMVIEEILNEKRFAATEHLELPSAASTREGGSSPVDQYFDHG